MAEARRSTAHEAPTQLNLFSDAEVASVVTVARVDPREFALDMGSVSLPDRQRHRWLVDRLAAQGFRIIRHTFHPAEIAGPWACENSPCGAVIYRQWPEPGGA